MDDAGGIDAAGAAGAVDADGSYRERRSRLPGAVLWKRTDRLVDAAAAGTEHRILPDGCIDLLLIDGRLQIAGPDSTASLVTATAGRRYTAIRFPAGLGSQILAVHAAEIRDSRPLLDQLWPPSDVRSWEQRLDAAVDKAATLEGLVLGRSGSISIDRQPVAIAALLGRGLEINTVATTLGWTERRLHRRSLEAFGYPPSVLRRILRFQRALSTARSGPALAQVAADCGYTDQAHLARDVKALAGVPMGQLL